MAGPRAVVIPFGVPTEARGLGLGLAALVHSFTHIDGQSVALAQLLSRPREDHDDAETPSGPVEAFLSPQAWQDLTGFSPAPSDVAIVVTGALEPPRDGKGMIQLLAFDAKDGSTRARAEAHVGGVGAGQSILAAFDEVWAKVGGELGQVRDIGDLDWDALESVLRAERCVLHDPARNGPHDRLAAMMHLGRAVEDAPEARFPVGRLAAVALGTAMAPSFDRKLADAALRALTRASEDAPTHLDLVEAGAALHVRLGNPKKAEERVTWAIAQAPERARLYAILSEARRAQADLDGALAAVDAGLRNVRDDGLLATERGVVLAQRGDVSAAEAAWKTVLSHNAVHAAAFVNLAALAAARKELPLAQVLVDQALQAASSEATSPEVLRRAIQLAVATEPDGVPRAARVARLGECLIAKVPGDLWGVLVLAQARVRLGETSAALLGFTQVVTMARESALAAEAQRERLALSDRHASLEIEATLRAAEREEGADLEGVAARGRALAAQHQVWTAAFAGGVAERRRGRWVAAREAFDAALALAPGATPAHLELSDVCIALGKPDVALAHAERAVSLEGSTVRTLIALARALDASGRHDEAVATARAGLAMDPAELRFSAIVDGSLSEPPRGLPDSSPPSSPPPTNARSLWQALRGKLRR